jgi:5'-nucleotidase
MPITMTKTIKKKTGAGRDKKPLVLVTNDDGINSPGVLALFGAVSRIAHAVLVAPDGERSAAGHSLTMHRPLKVTEVAADMYSVNGTPTDCVTLGVAKVLKRAPDLVVSGINKGGNLGDDITYSGTVSAAIEGTILGVKSIAFSLVGQTGFNFDAAAVFAGQMALLVLEKGLPKDTLLNVNVPNIPASSIAGVKFARQGKRTYTGAVHETFDPWGRMHYWIGGGLPVWEGGEDTDIDAVENGFISVTPIHLDLTNHAALKCLKKEWKGVFKPF